MSFSPLDCYPGDKSSYGQSCEELGADFFDQFLTYSPMDNEQFVHSTLQESTFLGGSGSEKHSLATSSNSFDFKTKNVLDYGSWKDDLAFQQSTQEIQLYSELTGRAAMSDSDLLSLENITLGSPQFDTYSCSSLPPYSSPAGEILAKKKSRIAKCLSNKVRKVANTIEKRLRSPIRKPDSVSRLNTSELWGEKLDAPKIDLDFVDSTLPLSPPPSSKIPQHPETFAGIKQEEQHNGRFGFNNELLPNFGHAPSAYHTPLSTPLPDSEGSRRTSSQHHSSDTAPFPSTPKMGPGSDRWSQLPNPPNVIKHGRRSMYAPPDCDAPLWWNHASTAPMAQPLPTALQTNPQRATKSLALQLQNDLSYRANERAYMPTSMRSGFMIQLPGSPLHQSFAAQTSPKQHQSYFPTHPHHYHARPRDVVASSRYQQSSRPTRKNPSASSDSDSQSPSPTFRVRKRRTPRRDKHSTPRTLSRGGSIDFVNYTPNDSKKILTGVAPSGSSKTKARREKEAMERRRRLSQAAFRAVREAGGDIESLVEQGLLV
jgi:hypothetical protein